MQFDVLSNTNTFHQAFETLKKLEMRNGHISTSGLKSDVTIEFLDPDFICDARTSAFANVRGRYRPKIYVCMDFEDILAYNRGFKGIGRNRHSSVSGDTVQGGQKSKLSYCDRYFKG